MQDAISKGATVAVGGKRPEYDASHPLSKGSFYEPTVLTGMLSGSLGGGCGGARNGGGGRGSYWGAQAAGMWGSGAGQVCPAKVCIHIRP